MFATQEQVKRLKERALDWKDAGYPDADPLIKEAMELILRLPWIAPVWSCEGHWKDADGGRTKHQDFYILFAIEASGFPAMEKIYTRLRERLLTRHTYNIQVSAEKKRKILGNLIPTRSPAYSSVLDLKLSFSTRNMPGSDIDKGEVEWYHSLLLGGNTHGRAAKHIFFKEFMEVLKEVVAECVK